MSESIRKFKNNDELIKELENRGLVFPDKESKEIFISYLIQYGYFSFVKKLSSDLMYSDADKKIFKKEFTSNNLRYLFDIDRNISIIIFKYFRNIEFLLNSSMLKVIGRKLNKTSNCPYIATLNSKSLDDLFPNVISEMPLFKKWEKNPYSLLYEDLFKNFNNKDIDCKKIIKENKEKEKFEIKEKIEKGWFRNFVNEQNKKKNIRTFPDWEYLDIFSLFQTLNFTQLIRIFSFLSAGSKNDVIKEFFSYFKTKNKNIKIKCDSFEYIISIFADLRNVLMHNGCVININFKIEEKIRENIEKFFNVQTISNNEIKLNEIIFIMELIINIKGKMFDEINESVNNKLKNRTQRPDDVSRLIFEIIKDKSRIDIKY